MLRPVERLRVVHEALHQELDPHRVPVNHLIDLHPVEPLEVRQQFYGVLSQLFAEPLYFPSSIDC